MYNTHTMLQKQSLECTRVLIFKREKIRRLEYALFLLVLWRLGVETGRHGDPGVAGHLGCSCIQFPKHYWWSLRFFIHFGLLKQPPAGQQKEKEQVFCVQLEHYRSCLKLLEHSIEPMTKMMTYCSQSTPFQGWATPTLAQENKHCQRHNGPGGWVHFAKVTFHLQNLA